MARRIHILEQCVECGQRSLPGHALCRLHYQRVREASDRARDDIRHELEKTSGSEQTGPAPAGSPRDLAQPQGPLPDRYPGSICPHGWPDWGDCAACTDAADFDDGETGLA